MTPWYKNQRIHYTRKIAPFARAVCGRAIYSCTRATETRGDETCKDCKRAIMEGKV